MSLVLKTSDQCYLFKGQATPTRTLFYRQYTSFLEELAQDLEEIAEEVAPPAVGTGLTLGACKYLSIGLVFWYFGQTNNQTYKQ